MFTREQKKKGPKPDRTGQKKHQPDILTDDRKCRPESNPLPPAAAGEVWRFPVLLRKIRSLRLFFERVRFMILADSFRGFGWPEMCSCLLWTGRLAPADVSCDTRATGSAAQDTSENEELENAAFTQSVLVCVSLYPRCNTRHDLKKSQNKRWFHILRRSERENKRHLLFNPYIYSSWNDSPLRIDWIGTRSDDSIVRIAPLLPSHKQQRAPHTSETCFSDPTSDIKEKNTINIQN